MKNARLSLCCLVVSMIATTVSAGGICIQDNSGCRDLVSGQVYVRSGDELVDSETKQVYMTLKPVIPHIQTEQDRRDALRYEAEAKAQAKLEAENERLWAIEAARMQAQRERQWQNQRVDALEAAVQDAAERERRRNRDSIGFVVPGGGGAVIPLP